VERLDLIGFDLVIIMELADHQLGDRFHECIAQGLPGIPREELIGYLMEAAEALDLISAKHGLQHMDVKPANLFLTSGHVKLGDYGLVNKLEGGKYCLGNRGFTPEYAAPEAHQGKIHSRSDQYSLALVYHELLTGTFPFACNTPQQIMAQHLSATPDLSRLPERDRPTVVHALSKQPEDRFPSCMAFIRALTILPSAPVSTTRLALITPSKKRPSIPEHPAKQSDADQPLARDLHVGASGNPTPRTSHKFSLSVALTGGRQNPPRLITSSGLAKQSSADATSTPPPVSPSTDESYGPFPFKLELIRSIFPVEHLMGRPSCEPLCNAEELVRKVVLAAQAGESTVSRLGRVVQQPDGSWSCRFLSSIDPRVAQVKLHQLRDETGATIESANTGRVVFRRPILVPVKSSIFGISSMQELNSGLEVVVQLPEPGRGAAEILTTGKLYGSPPVDFERVAGQAIVKLIQEIHEQLNNIEERRQFPRFPATFPVTLLPLHPDGRPDSPIHGRCKDVSESGLSIFSPSKPLTRHLYVAFDRVSGIEDLAVLVQIVRTEECANEILICGRYRLDFGPEEPSK
jgi:serine/threonine protein kinase